jgi:O-antigen ligase
MMVVGFWWQRHRWTLLFTALALALGGALGALSRVLLALPPHPGSRPEFYLELFFAVVGALGLGALLLVRAQLGLPVLLALLTFLPSRTGMQLQFTGYVVIAAVDVAVLAGVLILMLHAKVLYKRRLQPVVLRTPLWAWVVVAPLGTLVALARGVPWANWLPELKGFYLWILVVVLCVNVIRTRQTLRLIMLSLVLSAVPSVFFEVRSVATGESVLAVQLANGVVVNRTAGGAGLINPYAFYLMAVFFVALGMGMTAARWLPRVFYFGCAVLFMVGIFETYTRGAWIATVVGLLVLGIAGGRRMLAVLVGAMVLGYVLMPSTVWARLSFTDSSVAERVGYLHTALATVQAYPLLGGGWGSNFYLVGNVVVPSFKPNDIPFWHNDYLIVATQVGLPGLAVFLWIWVALAWITLRTYVQAPRGTLRTYLLVFLAALAAMCTQALTDMFFWRNETGPLIWLIVGLTCVTINLIRAEGGRDAASGPTAFRLPPEPTEGSVPCP